MSVSIAGSDSLSVGSSEDPILHARGGHKFSLLPGPALSPPTLVPHSNPPWESRRNKGSADDPRAKHLPCALLLLPPHALHLYFRLVVIFSRWFR